MKLASRCRKSSFLLCCAGSLMACASVEPVRDAVEPPGFSTRYDSIFAARPDIVTPREIHQLTARQEAEFIEYLNSPGHGSTPIHRRVSDYLEEITEGFSYHTHTNSAAEAIELSEGNCLSLAILTTAIARLANVEVGYQLVDSTPVFEFREKVVLKGVHVRTRLYEQGWTPQEDVFVYARPGVQVDYFADGTERFMENLSEQDYIARYYLNQAADAIGEEDYHRAYWLSLEAINFDSLSSDAFNSLAVIYKRMGEVKKSEEIYLYGIENLPNKLTFLKNYRGLLIEQGRHSEARGLMKRIAGLDDPSPFHWFHAAREAYNSGDYREAISFYKRAVEIAPYLHELSFGLSKAYYQLGKLSAAERYLQIALHNAYEQEIRALYSAELTALALEGE